MKGARHDVSHPAERSIATNTSGSSRHYVADHRATDSHRPRISPPPKAPASRGPWRFRTLGETGGPESPSAHVLGHELEWRPCAESRLIDRFHVVRVRLRRDPCPQRSGARSGSCVHIDGSRHQPSSRCWVHPWPTLPALKYSA